MDRREFFKITGTSVAWFSIAAGVGIYNPGEERHIDKNHVKLSITHLAEDSSVYIANSLGEEIFNGRATGELEIYMDKDTPQPLIIRVRKCSLKPMEYNINVHKKGMTLHNLQVEDFIYNG